MNALELCNCCDVEQADDRCPAGYCTPCWRAAQAGTVCPHDQAA